MISVILILLGLVFPANLPAQGARVVARYIEALQGLDYRTIMDLSYSCQRDVAAIKAQNPEDAWPELVEEYYDSKISSITAEHEFRRTNGDLSDLAQNIRALTRLLPPSAKWSIIDSRSGPAVSVSISYSSIEESPIVDGKCLRQAILQFEIHAETQLVMTVRRLPKTDATWSKVPAYLFLEPKGYLTDAASVFSAAEAQRLEVRCAALYRRGRVQIVIVTVPTLEGDLIEKVALHLFTTWEIGPRGVLLLLAVRERQSRITVGHELENAISDSVAAAALKEMRPDLRNGDYEAAINIALDSLAKSIDSPR